MPSITLHPPRQQNSTQSSPAPQLPPLSTAGTGDNTRSYNLQPGPGSPVAPEYSPITPKAQPALPAKIDLSANPLPGSNNNGQANPAQDSVAQPPPAEFIPEPAPQPFSGEDATDAIALRAAISSLQFQKKKAQDDIRALERIKKKALENPELFRTELAAGRLQEQRPKIGDLQAILDHEGDDDDEEEVVFGASADDGMDVDSAEAENESTKPKSGPFERIPGPQNVVRMPYVNWDKYHMSGEALDSMHEQQRKWPGSPAYGQDRGREFAVAAPYSPWLDSIDGQAQQQQKSERNDSMAMMTPTTAVTPTGSTSEHPMETRRRTNQ